MSIVAATTADADASGLQLEQARAALSIHLQGCQVLRYPGHYYGIWLGNELCYINFNVDINEPWP